MQWHVFAEVSYHAFATVSSLIDSCVKACLMVQRVKAGTPILLHCRCKKHETGYDDPQLSIMFLDKAFKDPKGEQMMADLKWCSAVQLTCLL